MGAGLDKEHRVAEETRRAVEEEMKPMQDRLSKMEAKAQLLEGKVGYSRAWAQRRCEESEWRLEQRLNFWRSVAFGVVLLKYLHFILKKIQKLNADEDKHGMRNRLNQCAGLIATHTGPSLKSDDASGPIAVTPAKTVLRSWVFPHSRGATRAPAVQPLEWLPPQLPLAASPRKPINLLMLRRARSAAKLLV